VLTKKELLEQLKTIPDYRVDTGKIEYPLHEILFMTLFALLKGNNTFKDIVSWMQYFTFAFFTVSRATCMIFFESKLLSTLLIIDFGSFILLSHLQISKCNHNLCRIEF